MANNESATEKRQRFDRALQQFIERIAEDRYILAVVLVGSLTEELIWRREAISIWIIEADGVARRLRSDGNDERVFRTLVEDGINIHAELIPRTRFKLIVEGSSRTAFSCNFFATRKLIHSKDPSIDTWFEQANQVAQKDRDRELLIFSTWTIYAHRLASKRLNIKQDLHLAAQGVLECAHSVAYTEIIRMGEICEQDAIDRANELNPELFAIIYSRVLEQLNNAEVLRDALSAIDGYLESNYVAHMAPLLAYLKKANRVLPLSELSDHFAYSQVYPWHLEAACEWLEQKGHLDKLSAPFKLTSRSHAIVEEPAYFMNE